ncbi:CRISPR-associated protein Cas4 [Desulfovibrio sp. JC022]|uniref:CRISPR-associated protein Cas4 n=1 Tax=Desulfovibrio sp. JC022 TaxID=2593642 RepID=UPI0013CF84BA|nr:CRISPR-associated protein Cas4 [Desulfovibrio sp. JC022]NDV24307.1 CRISPR-associated protein Cas4 [Desulfovibrio sp. JC022]
MSELLPISALQHYLFCPRQCALIHVEKVWVENRFTVEGRIMHRRVDSEQRGRRAGADQDLSVPLKSERLGLYGIADVVEMVPGPDGREIPYPVEYKRGSPKILDWDRVQLCAQAICLEEMLGLFVPEGAIFYGKPRRRDVVVFDDKLKLLVKETAMELHKMIAEARTPPPVKDKKCRSCSLAGECMPGLGNAKVESYLLSALKE